MPDKGLDYSLGRPDLDEARAAGYVFVLRYLSWRPNPKCITPGELGELLAHEFHVGLNWEFDAEDALGGANMGRIHGLEAVRQANMLGYPAGCTIYFSADFDETEGQASTVEEYMRAAGGIVHAANFRMGAYGGYYTIKRLLDAAAIEDGWQAFAWSGGQWDPRAALRQVQNGVTVGGADCDINEQHGTTYLMGDPPAQPPKEDGMFLLRQISDGSTYKIDGVDPATKKVRAYGVADELELADLKAAGFEVREVNFVNPKYYVFDPPPADGSAPTALTVKLTGTASPA